MQRTLDFSSMYFGFHYPPKDLKSNFQKWKIPHSLYKYLPTTNRLTRDLLAPQSKIWKFHLYTIFFILISFHIITIIFFLSFIFIYPNFLCFSLNLFSNPHVHDKIWLKKGFYLKNKENFLEETKEQASTKRRVVLKAKSKNKEILNDESKKKKRTNNIWMMLLKLYMHT
jgi:hypothetical protein